MKLKYVNNKTKIFDNVNKNIKIIKIIKIIGMEN